jgi:hypothetical protein
MNNINSFQIQEIIIFIALLAAAEMNLLLLSAQFIALFVAVEGHGRLIDPPSRVTLGRYFPGHAFDTTDMGYNCGGVRVRKIFSSASLFGINNPF